MNKHIYYVNNIINFFLFNKISETATTTVSPTPTLDISTIQQQPKKQKKLPTEKQLLALEKARKKKAEQKSAKVDELNETLAKPKKSKVKVVEPESFSSEEEKADDTVLYYQPHDEKYVKKLDDVHKMLSYILTTKQEKKEKKKAKKKQPQPQKNLLVEHHKSQINKTPMSSSMFD